MCDCAEIECRVCFPGGATSHEWFRARNHDRMRSRMRELQFERTQYRNADLSGRELPWPAPDFARLATSPGRLPPPEE